MKFLIIVAAFVTLAYAEHVCTDREKFLEYRAACASANGVTDEQIEHLKQYQFDLENESVYCHVKCIFEKMDLFKDGTFVTDNVLHQLHHGTKDLDDAAVRADLDSCVEEFKAEEDKCKFAFNVLKCFNGKNDKNLGYLKSSFVAHTEGEHEHAHVHDHAHHH
uniref:CSON000114 protein n=1 Tax=Culicoides sonorensis TaxID=179676 RepID=A0A336MEB4_CULSO